MLLPVYVSHIWMRTWCAQECGCCLPCRDGLMDQVERLLLVASGDELSGSLSTADAHVRLLSAASQLCLPCRMHSAS